MMGQAGFNLWLWSSNSNFLQKVITKDKTVGPSISVGILSLCWNTATDTLSFTPKVLPSDNHRFIPKHDVLQSSSQIYNSLGWATSVTINARILLQEVWYKNISWDDPLDSGLHDKMDDILALLLTKSIFLASIHIKNLYAFKDATTTAYGAESNLSSHVQKLHSTCQVSNSTWIGAHAWWL